MLFCKEMFMKQLRQLPEDILQEVYFLDIAILKGRLQWDSFLAHRYKKQQKVTHCKGWLEFEIGDWLIQMEKED